MGERSSSDPQLQPKSGLRGGKRSRLPVAKNEGLIAPNSGDIQIGLFDLQPTEESKSAPEGDSGTIGRSRDESRSDHPQRQTKPSRRPKIDPGTVERGENYFQGETVPPIQIKFLLFEKGKHQIWHGIKTGEPRPGWTQIEYELRGQKRQSDFPNRWVIGPVIRPDANLDYQRGDRVFTSIRWYGELLTVEAQITEIAPCGCNGAVILRTQVCDRDSIKPKTLELQAPIANISRLPPELPHGSCLMSGKAPTTLFSEPESHDSNPTSRADSRTAQPQSARSRRTRKRSGAIASSPEAGTAIPPGQRENYLPQRTILQTQGLGSDLPPEPSSNTSADLPPEPKNFIAPGNQVSVGISVYSELTWTIVEVLGATVRVTGEMGDRTFPVAAILPPEPKDPVAPDGAWIETCKVSGKNFRQAYWRSREAIFTPKRGGNPEAKCKKQYIGKVGGVEHRKAIAAIERRNQLKKSN